MMYLLVLVIALSSSVSAYRGALFMYGSKAPTSLYAEINGDDIPRPYNRRQILSNTAALISASATFTIFTPRQPAYAATNSPPTKDELNRIKVGYDQIRYLLDNWEKETTVCRENGGQCNRDADAVRKYLGLRSTKDPLFQIEKVFAKVKYMDDFDPDKLEEFYDATEEWNTAQNMSNSMAFISQFGEYNPGGGKDEVLKYLNESQKQVLIAESALKKIVECLNL